MDTRPRILVVEDDEVLRDSWIDLLHGEGFTADGAASASEAMAATSLCTYHVALVDIMLAGDDTSNTDGVDVVRHLRRLREDTDPVVLSGQDSISLVRDLLREHGAVDYLEKNDVQEKGNAFLVQKIRALVDMKHVPSQTNWKALTYGWTRGLSESLLANQCMRFLEFSGGSNNLSASLTTACKHLVPLLGEIGVADAISRAKLPHVFSGRFWSKGQRSSVELLIYGKNATPEELDAGWDFSYRTAIYNRTKGGLSIVVLECPDLAREKFEALSSER